MGQRSIVMYGLAIVYLYIQSLREKENYFYGSLNKCREEKGKVQRRRDEEKKMIHNKERDCYIFD